jgi:mannose-6-phosphate isomerase-like protein (cupin superfamily)
MSKIAINDFIKLCDQAWEVQDLIYVNNTALRMAKIQGSYIWHTHQNEDEFFLVVKGKISIDTNSDDGTVELKENEGYVVKKGVRHRSRTTENEPAWVLLVEPRETKTKG